MRAFGIAARQPQGLRLFLTSIVLISLLGLTACQAAPPASAPAAPPAAPAEPAAQAPKPAAEKPAEPKPIAPAKPAAGTPERGGELVFAVGAEPPSFDGHRETTFAMVHPTAPHYSLLVKFDPFDHTKIIPDIAESWNISSDALTYTFKIRQGVKFHDGSTLTSKDVKATYDKIIFPSEGVRSARQAMYSAVKSVEAPDPNTVVFTLEHPSASMLSLLASPWNYIYSAEKLAQDPRWYEKNVMGTGPFTFEDYVRGSHWVGKRFDDYWDKGKPYLDGFRALFIGDTAARVAAVRGGRAHIEFRGFTPSARDDLVRAMGAGVTVQESPWACGLGAALNTEQAPFNDARFRRALSLALDRWQGSQALQKVAFVKEVGGLMRPGSPFAMPEEQLVGLAGYSKDGEGSKAQARELLQQAGVQPGFSFVLKNRNVQMPYEPVAVFLLDQWKKIGLNVEHQVLETAAYNEVRRSGDFQAVVDFACDFMDEPDIQLAKFVSRSRSPINYSRYEDEQLDALYDRQARETDVEKRKQLVWQFERRVLDEQAYWLPALWWHRIIPHSSQLKGWKISPSHYLNQDLSTVWLDQ